MPHQLRVFGHPTTRLCVGPIHGLRISDLTSISEHSTGRHAAPRLPNPLGLAYKICYPRELSTARAGNSQAARGPKSYVTQLHTIVDLVVTRDWPRSGPGCTELAKGGALGPLRAAAGVLETPKSRAGLPIRRAHQSAPFWIRLSSIACLSQTPSCDHFVSQSAASGFLWASLPSATSLSNAMSRARHARAYLSKRPV